MIENGKITSTTLGYGSGCLQFWVTIEGEQWGQSFGGWTLDSPPSEHGGDREPSEACGRAIAGLLNVFEIQRWEDLTGQFCRVERNSLMAPIDAIGHITKNRWFRTSDYVEGE